MTRESAIAAGFIRPAGKQVRFDSLIRMWVEFEGPTILGDVDEPTLRLLPGERERFEHEARNPPPLGFGYDASNPRNTAH
jgi:hypothetical protein